MTLTVEIEREADGRWVAEVPDLPGVLAYGQTRDEAVARVEALALRVLADRLEHGETGPDWVGMPFRAAVVFAFHEGEELGPRMLARLARTTGLRPEDL